MLRKAKSVFHLTCYFARVYIFIFIYSCILWKGEYLYIIYVSVIHEYQIYKYIYIYKHCERCSTKSRSLKQRAKTKWKPTRSALSECFFLAASCGQQVLMMGVLAHGEITGKHTRPGIERVNTHVFRWGLN